MARTFSGFWVSPEKHADDLQLFRRVDKDAWQPRGILATYISAPHVRMMGERNLDSNHWMCGVRPMLGNGPANELSTPQTGQCSDWLNFDIARTVIAEHCSGEPFEKDCQSVREQAGKEGVGRILFLQGD